MSPRIRETRNVFTFSSSRSSPTTYHWPRSKRSAYGFTVRSRCSSRTIDQYSNFSVRFLEIAPSSFASRPGSSGEYPGSWSSTARAVSRRRLLEARPAEGEVLEREAERLRVGELALEEIETGLERGELLVGQLERRQEVALGAQAVELLARELVALGVERDPEREQLGPVGVEASGERLVRHLLVALDVLLDVAGGQRPALGHQEGDE